MDAGFRKNRISLLRDMVMQMAPITIRKRLNKANMAAATLRSDRKETTVFVRNNQSSYCAEAFCGRYVTVEQCKRKRICLFLHSACAMV